MVVLIFKHWFYAGSCIGPFIIIRERNYNVLILNHEVIHHQQLKECLYIFGYLIYWVEFLFKLVYYRSPKRAYQEVSFEREAKIFEGLVGYVYNRKPYTFVKYIFWKPKMLLTIDFDSDNSKFDTLFSSPEGTVFKYTKKIETLLTTIQAKKPVNITEFKVTPVTVGTSAYALYGANTLVITKKTTT